MLNFENYKYLLLDRDGVINIERPSDYVKTADEFIFIEGAIQAIKKLSRFFDRVFVVTNQRGISRNKMTLDDLNSVHSYMLREINNVSGKIDKIYFCTDSENTSINRKPNIGMAFQIKNDYPDFEFEKAIMIGNSLSDIIFGKKLGMLTVLVGDKYPKEHIVYSKADLYCENLAKFVDLYKKQK